MYQIVICERQYIKALATHGVLNHGCRFCFFFQAEDGIRDLTVTGVQTCALPICQLGEQPLVVRWHLVVERTPGLRDERAPEHQPLEAGRQPRRGPGDDVAAPAVPHERAIAEARLVHVADHAVHAVGQRHGPGYVGDVPPRAGRSGSRNGSLRYDDTSSTWRRRACGPGSRASSAPGGSCPYSLTSSA